MLRTSLPSEAQVLEAEVQREVDDRQQEQGVRGYQDEGDLAGRHRQTGAGQPQQTAEEKALLRRREEARRGGRSEAAEGERGEETAEGRERQTSEKG